MLFREQRTISSCTKKLRANPQDLQALKQRALAWIQLKEYRHAISDFNRAVKLKRRDAKVYYHRGLAYVGLKEYEQAIYDWSEAIRINPQYASAYHNRGQAYAILQEYDRAIADFNQAIRINPNYALAYRNRALVHHVLERYEQALADYDQAIRLEPNNHLAYFNRSIIIRTLEKQGKSPVSFVENPLPQRKKQGNYGPSNGILSSINRVWLAHSGVIAGAVSFVLLVSLVPLVTSYNSDSQEFGIVPQATRNLSDSPVSFPAEESKPKLARLSKRINTFQEVAGIPYGLFNYGGSSTWAPIRKEVDRQLQAEVPEFKLRYLQHPIRIPSSGVGIEMLLSNQLTIAQSSRPLKPKEYQLAQKQNFNLKQIAVAIDGIAIAVNPNLNIPGLTIAQLKDIYAGKITNWKQVGGPNLEISAYSKSPQVSGTAQFFIKQILNQEHIFGSNIKLVTNTTQTLRKVSANKGAIFYASASEVVGQCKIKPLPIGQNADKLIAPYMEPLVTPEQCPAKRNQINHQVFQNGEYLLTRSLFVIIKQNGDIEEQAGQAYTEMLLSDQGQNLIEKAGFVPIR